MTVPNKSFETKTTTGMNDPTEQIKNELREKGVNPDVLAVCLLGPEMLYGEVMEQGPVTAGKPLLMRNPRRIIRLQQMNQSGFRVELLMIDFDLVTGGVFSIAPDAVYAIEDLDAESKGRMLNMYLNYLKDKVRQSAADAGIIIAKPGGPKPPRA